MHFRLSSANSYIHVALGSLMGTLCPAQQPFQFNAGVLSPSATLQPALKAAQRRFFALKREAWFEQQRSYPYAHIPAGAYWRAQMEKQALIERRNQSLVLARPDTAKSFDAFSGLTWTPWSARQIL